MGDVTFQPPAVPRTPGPLTFQQRLDAAPLTRTMAWLWLLSAGLIALDGFDFFIVGIALPFVQRAFALTPALTGAVAVAALVGALVGSLTLGAVTDRVGRQPMLLVDIALFVGATLGTVLAWNVGALIGFRFLLGVAIGADYPISVAYIIENVPTRYRGRLVIGAFAFQAVGALLGALTGWGVIYGFGWLYPDQTELAVQYAWRWMLGVGLLLALAIAALRANFLLESPGYLMARGDYEQASEAASRLLNQAVTLTPTTDPLQPADTLTYGDLFAPVHRRATILAAVPWFLQDIATYGIGIFTPVILGTLAFSTAPNFMAQTKAAAQGSVVVDVFLIGGFILAISLVESVGRIRLQIIGFGGMALGLGLLASSTLAPTGSRPELLLVFSGFILFNLLMNAGPNATTFLLSGEVFPTAIRASGAGFAAAFAKAGAVVGTFTLPLVQEALGLAPMLLLLALLCLGAAGVTYGYRPQTGPIPD